MAVEESFRLPDLGEGLADAELLHWHVAVGDTVTLNQVIAEVETAKAAVELPSPYAGQVLALHASEGETVTVGTPIITFAVDAPASASPGASPAPDQAGAAGPAGPVEERVPVLVGYGATSGTASRRRHGRPRPTGVASARVAEPQAPTIGAPRVGSPASREAHRDLAPADPEPMPAPAISAAPVAPVARVAPAVPLKPADPATSGSSTAPSTPAPDVTRPLAKPLVRKLARDNGV